MLSISSKSRPLTFTRALLGLLLLFSAPAWAQESWILIDTDELKLSVMRGDEPVRVFENVSIGRNGATGSKIYRDQKTPLGSFRISRVKENSRYHLFFGIDYPDLLYARRAFEDGVINLEEFDSIRRAHENGVEPPASTPLGGFIGIHGVGDGDLAIHEEFNWTDGCIALNNDEVDELRKWIRLQMVVLII